MADDASELQVSRRLLDPLGRTLAAGAPPTRELLARLPGDGELGASAYRRLLERAAALEGDPCLPLRVGLETRARELGLWQYAVATAPSLRVAVETGARLLPLIHAGVELGVRDGTGDGVALYALERGHPGSATGEVWLGMLVGSLGRSLGLRGEREPDDVRALELSGGAQRRARLGALLGAPVRAAAHDAVLLDPHALDRTLPWSDPEVHQCMLHSALEALARTPRHVDWKSRTRLEIERALGPTGEALARRDVDGPPDLPAVARALGVSRATLARRLAEEGTGFRELLDEVRALHAKRELARGERTLGEIAYALGFANPAAFHRAFKRWTRVNPGDYRRSARGG